MDARSSPKIALLAVTAVLAGSGILAVALGFGVLSFNLQSGLYPGDLTLSVSEGAIQPILELPLETYLEGVVPYEMSDSFPLEALKAQAVCARTYALSKMNGSGDYDVVDNTNDQVYYGVKKENDNAARADRDIGTNIDFINDSLPIC